MSAKWITVHAAVAGGRHLASGTPCQDASAAGTTGAGRYFIAVADGRGSSSSSQAGSRLVCQRLPELLHTLEPTVAHTLDSEGGAGTQWTEIVSMIVGTLISDFRDEAVRLEVSPDHLETTLTFAVAGRRCFGWAQIGDSPLVALTTSNVMGKVDADVRPPEYVGVTQFLGPNLRRAQDVRTGTIPAESVQTLFAASDGFASAFVGARGVPTSAWWQLAMAAQSGKLTAAELNIVLAAMHWTRLPFDDDRALAIVFPCRN